MGSNLFATFLMLLLVVSGAPAGGNGRSNDLLDLIPTASYWRAKAVTVSRTQLETDVNPAKANGDIPKLVKDLESLSRRDAARKQLEAIGAATLEDLRAETQADDPEAAAIARETIANISVHGKEAAVRRLMAIRTLGERKEKDSLALLKGLQDSKELFVADYAARAVAAIEGSPWRPADHRAELAGDVNLLPATTGIVAQTTGLGWPGFTIETLVAQMQAINGPAGVAPPGGNEDTIDRLTKELLDYAEKVGNVRADGMTLAISDDIGGRNEWVFISVHGLYDREAVGSFLENMAGGNAALVRNDNMLTLDMHREARVLMPSNQQLIFVTANPANTPLASVMNPLMEALTSGKPGTLSDNKKLAALIQSIDKSGPAWAVAIPSPAMKRLPAIGAFDTMSLAAKDEKDTITITATGRGEQDAHAAQDQVNGLQAQLVDTFKGMAGRTKDYQPLVDALQSVKVTVDEKGATATATASRDVLRSIVAAMIQNLPGLMSSRPPNMQRGMPVQDDIP